MFCEQFVVAQSQCRHCKRSAVANPPVLYCHAVHEAGEILAERFLVLRPRRRPQFAIVIGRARTPADTKMGHPICFQVQLRALSPQPTRLQPNRWQIARCRSKISCSLVPDTNQVAPVPIVDRQIRHQNRRNQNRKKFRVSTGLIQSPPRLSHQSDTLSVAF